MASWGRKKGAEVAAKLKEEKSQSPVAPRTMLTKGDSVTSLGLTPKQMLEIEEQRQREEADLKAQQQAAVEQQRRQHEQQQRDQQQARDQLEWNSRQAKMRDWQNEDDTAQLSELSPDADVSYAPYAPSVYESYSKLTEFTRGLNTDRSWLVPEIVLVGPEGSGKTAVLEALLGFTLLSAPNRRPLCVHLVNNMDCEQARITVRRDAALEISNDVSVGWAALSSELDQRNAIDSDEPIVLLIEQRHSFTATFIDTPGLHRHAQTVAAHPRALRKYVALLDA
eukprot:TRINITY_DN5157_c0_g1_i2.p1 TRINITY_DN5157_c0_g1~~TRINITY_DN5157_c0_g1_i2.p1  ORF type:complete len:312 (+),score=81.32 TRINITY_DN5157_c0_g1_i2:95-937(+)